MIAQSYMFCPLLPFICIFSFYLFFTAPLSILGKSQECSFPYNNNPGHCSEVKEDGLD